MSKYTRSIEEIEKKAILWWPKELSKANAKTSIIPQLVKTQDDFLSILSLSNKEPFQVFKLIQASDFPANLFLKHLCVLADYGGEPIQRLGKAFSLIFKSNSIFFTWKEKNYTYKFKCLPIKGLGNKKLNIDGDGLSKSESLNDMYKDMIILLMFGSTSTVCDEAGLSSCEIGTLLEKRSSRRY